MTEIVSDDFELSDFSKGITIRDDLYTVSYPYQKVVVATVTDDVEFDISDLLLKDRVFKDSIERARKEMRRGEYLTHEEVFGD